MAEGLDTGRTESKATTVEGWLNHGEVGSPADATAHEVRRAKLRSESTEMKRTLPVLVALLALGVGAEDASAQLASVQQTVEVSIGTIVYLSVNSNTSNFTTTASNPTVDASHFHNGFWAYADPASIIVKANVATQVQIAAASGTTTVAAATTGNASKALSEFHWGTSLLSNASRGTSISTTAANVGTSRVAGDYSASADQLKVYYGMILDWDDKPDTYSVPVVFTVIAG